VALLAALLTFCLLQLSKEKQIQWERVKDLSPFALRRKNSRRLSEKKYSG
jgi:hypothetical protein